MSILNSILDKYPEEGFIKADGFDEAIIGVSTDIRLVYSIEKIIELLMKDMSEDDAIDYFYFNIDGAYLGDKTPIYIHLIN